MAREPRTYTRFYFRLKQWKKRLRRWKRPLWSLAAILLFLTMLTIGIQLSDNIRNLVEGKDNTASLETFAMLQGDEFTQLDKSAQLVLNQLMNKDEKREVVHRKQYICGKSDKALGKQNSRDIIQTMLNHPDWLTSVDSEGRVILEEQVDDMSETCKEQAHIGLDKDGNLTLYDGPPQKQKAIRTFFQLDVESMESALPPKVLKQLYQGIRITDMDEYHSVLSTFSDYAVEETEKVMKPTPVD
ncbi:BofC C-terminal domain-containing protein [Paenibacillus apiarius]|uniref:BofC C-terminal domain-containing protein n=1 Tax=Paenibacillus apiarius TaxID=46240 RepID=A0ABT4E1A5_9BACL|nr:BofC C-terminal domain-containing protein [Paenibacillus apiarius]MBN3525689.1 BofC C-terminal domain-containing protein [Paenibacillus apiarius]MCY9512950.1 BofC C-terminal domain-containing protein [Paenibacillus apiarius]MCY9522001.1 BofC C-terminal domain-containing protein [Paenibacillus apiarius]MCY9555046.1 BofC C-terminal domain-containing protein [Paenibacillus apiarius]MCY9558066.1 BofC C-terminal domain-containing protein [Paenibacillus apiarius]